MLDIIFLAMFAMVIGVVISVYLVRVKRRFILHRNIQIGLATFLAIVVIGFEIDIRFFTDWKELAAESPYFDSGLVYWALAIHLCFAIPCPIVWAVVIWRALKKFPSDLNPGEHSQEHRFWGRIAATLMLITAVTGSTFYWLAFVAS
jgi:uncharacterized membrane protein YozB (DUF420 family)